MARKQAVASTKAAAIAADRKRGGSVRQAVVFFLGVFAVGLALTLLFAPAAQPVDAPPIAATRVASVPRAARAAAPPVACAVDDATCVGKRELPGAAAPCRRAIEAQLAYRHEWKDAWYEEKFNRVMWSEPTTTLAYHGNKLQAQNGFGAWQNLSYFCVWSVAGDRVVKAGINE